MMEIVYLIDRMWGANGGTEGQLLMLLKHLDPARFRIHLICLRDTEWLQHAHLPCPVKVLHVGSLVSPATAGKILQVRRYLLENDISLVQTYFDDAYIVGALAGKLAGIPVISCRRNLGPAFWGRSGYLRAFRVLHRLVAQFLVNSEATGKAIVTSEGIPPGKIQVIYNGLDLSRFEGITEQRRCAERFTLGVSDEQILIGMVSHLRREKNLELFVDAAAALYSRFPQTRFAILGDGSYRPILESYVASRKLSQVMSLPGSVPDVVPYLAAFDIGVLTSDGESFSNAIIEYMAAGLPVVATGVGGTVEALREHGFLFPPNDLNKLVSVLTYLIGDKLSRLAAGTNGRIEATRKYSISRMVTAHEELYSRYLSGKATQFKS